MKTRAAVLEKGSKEFEIAELDVDEPRVGEVHIKYAAAGLCHSDLHLTDGVYGDSPRLPIVAVQASSSQFACSIVQAVQRWPVARTAQLTRSSNAVQPSPLPPAPNLRNGHVACSSYGQRPREHDRSTRAQQAS